MSEKIQVRAIGASEAERLLAGEHIAAYHIDFAYEPVLTPCTLTPTKYAGKSQATTRHDDVYHCEPTGPNNVVRPVGEPVGQIVYFASETRFGSTTEGSVFTTVAAEMDYAANNRIPTREARYFVADPQGPYALPEMPIYGAQVYISVIIEDYTPEDAQAVVEEALAVALQDRDYHLHKAQARAVADKRVNVYVNAREGRRLVGANVLSAESSYVAQQSGQGSGYSTETAHRDQVHHL